MCETYLQGKRKISYEALKWTCALGCVEKLKNYETYNNERKEQVIASCSKFQITRFRQQVTDSKL